jgi:hypothetical protein
VPAAAAAAEAPRQRRTTFASRGHSTEECVGSLETSPVGSGASAADSGKGIHEERTVDCLSAQTVGKGYCEAVTLMWSPSAKPIKGED